MDQKRLFSAIAISLVIMVAFQYLAPPARRHPATVPAPAHSAVQGATSPEGVPATGAPGEAAAANAAPRQVPRVAIDEPRIRGSVSLLGARLDDVVLPDYRETVAPNSPLVRLLEPRSDPDPYYVQFGWTPAPGAGGTGTTIPVPGQNTLWKADGDRLTPTRPVTLSWDNGQGQTFELGLSIDDNYMLTVHQRVRNTGPAPVALLPWSRIRRDYQPPTSGYSILFEGMIGVLDRELRQISYPSAKNQAEKADAARGPSNAGEAYAYADHGGWVGFTDKYWLSALVPDQATPVQAAFRYVPSVGADGQTRAGYQVDLRNTTPTVIPPAGDAMQVSRVFAGAKEVHLLDRYSREYDIPSFYTAVDFGHLWFLTRPFFFAIDWIYQSVGNFGVAIMIFTLCVKLLFFPLANRSYRSMNKMRVLQPRMTALREQYKDEPQKLQQAMMQLYKAEKVNPASGCLPMLLQVPVFFALYKVIFVTIEMRQAPFFGWIRDLSAPDPTNVFNLFGLIPFDPTQISPFLHLGAWPLIMGCTMFFQQRLNPTPPDPMQARLFQFMPILFTFMLARFPAGLVIYWSWNNLLTMSQQWLIMRQSRATASGVARTT